MVAGINLNASCEVRNGFLKVLALEGSIAFLLVLSRLRTDSDLISLNPTALSRSYHDNV